MYIRASNKTLSYTLDIVAFISVIFFLILRLFVNRYPDFAKIKQRHCTDGNFFLINIKSFFFSFTLSLAKGFNPHAPLTPNNQREKEKAHQQGH
jgi:hypothetical protein